MKSPHTILCILSAALLAAACSGHTPKSDDIDSLLSRLTLEEKAALLVGGSTVSSNPQEPAPDAQSLVMGNDLTNKVPGSGGHTAQISRLGIPGVVVADGPAGLRINPMREGTDRTFYCTAFPVGVSLASSWDPVLVEEVGKAIGNEVLEYGVDVLLAPGMNIMRSPLCGRNFEYYSEDPVLAGKIAAAYIRGIQSNGVGTSLKHYAVNNQETNRANLDARVDDRTMREIYLRGFEIAVKEGQPWTVMTANNYVNGEHSSQSVYLLEDILRGEWGYDGAVMTDWLCGDDAVKQIHAGNDLLMPGLPFQKEDIIAAVKEGRLAEADVDCSVRRVIELARKSPVARNYAYSDAPDLAAHAEVTRRSASDGIVLLKNNGALPLGTPVKTVALFGNTSYDFLSGGIGSGDVNSAYTVSLREGLENAGYRVEEGLASVYEKYLAENVVRKDPMDLFSTDIRAVEMDLDEEVMDKALAASDAAIFTLGRTAGEGHDRNERDDFLLTDNEKQAIAALAELAHLAGKPFIVVLNVGGVVETESWKERPDAILLAWQGGQEAGNSVADVLSGKVNPSGKLPMTFPNRLSDVESNVNFPQEGTDFPVTFGPIAGRVDYLQAMGVKPWENQHLRNIDYTEYEEGLWVGYRDFDHFGKDVSYPFGYGLSFTTFEYANASVKGKKGGYTVTVDVTNTGSVPGREVVELYVSAPKGRMEKPEQELKAFAKTRLLQPGETETIMMTFTDYDLASFDDGARAWVTEAGGEYTLRIAASSRDGRLTLPLTVKKAASWKVSEKPE